jgi:hypothetical protein
MHMTWKTDPSFSVYRALRRKYADLLALPAILRISRGAELTDTITALRIVQRAAESK